MSYTHIQIKLLEWTASSKAYWLGQRGNSNQTGVITYQATVQGVGGSGRLPFHEGLVYVTGGESAAEGHGLED